MTVVIFLSFASVLIRSEFLSSFILFVSFLFLLYFIIKENSYKIIKKDVLILSLPFVITLIGLLFTSEHIKGVEFIIRSSPLLLIPIIYLKVSYEIISKAYDFIIKYFPFLTIFVLLFYIIVGFFYTYKGYGNYLYYSNFSEIADIHTTYLGLILNLSLWFVLKRKTDYKKTTYYSLFLIFFIFQFIVASKISLLVCVLLIIFDVFLSFKSTLSKTIISVSIVGLSIFFAKQFIENRFLNEKIEDGINLTGTQVISNFYKNDVLTRTTLWRSNIETLNGIKWIFGNGTSASSEDRKINYKRNNLETAYENSYNAHNQFVEILYAHGLLGLMIFIFHCISILWFSCKTKGIKLNAIIYVIMLLYFMTESILQRTIGIVLYSFIITYIYIQHRRLKYEPK